MTSEKNYLRKILHEFSSLPGAPTGPQAAGKPPWSIEVPQELDVTSLKLS